MANCELSNLGVEFGDKIKEMSSWLGGLGERSLFPERLTRGNTGNKESRKRKLNIASVFSPKYV